VLQRTGVCLSEDALVGEKREGNDDLCYRDNQTPYRYGPFLIECSLHLYKSISQYILSCLLLLEIALLVGPGICPASRQVARPGISKVRGLNSYPYFLIVQSPFLNIQVLHLPTFVLSSVI
jgi:hypothetical protein